jgi:hypothetical protein
LGFLLAERHHCDASFAERPAGKASSEECPPVSLPRTFSRNRLSSLPQKHHFTAAVCANTSSAVPASNNSHTLFLVLLNCVNYVIVGIATIHVLQISLKANQSRQTEPFLVPNFFFAEAMQTL